ncbi:TetR/AcrR family transcriptional regulator [Proteiniclasticum sp. BAD-10]|uniref:TetR/AcrR family transcriptional regulator n=1 Tax=Proteiniclasticum sediminis TaxID=2804028 RepID=A0A941HPV1_9CLOT|nr:TetR/AcrR family transcriptional regulator [Proteiniclasticum sediminis]MBR0575744.1 TetR/AcrR family transcriptional regulator [Proteiniclasticum sediminis]
MPPKVRITDDAILDAALAITREKGIDGVNVREIAKALDCSIQPVFRNFQSMENLKNALYQRVEEEHNAAMEKGLQMHPIPFLGLGMAYIQFAKEEKNLYKFLFMSAAIPKKGFLEMIKEEENQPIVDLIAQMTGLPRKTAEELFMDIWLMVQGIASLVATNDFEVSEAEIEKILKDTFLGLKMQLAKTEEQ